MLQNLSSCGKRVQTFASAIVHTPFCARYQRIAIDEIAKVCGVGRDAVSSWLDQWNRDGDEGLKDKAKSGRRPTLSEKETVEAIATALQVPQSPARQLAEIEKNTGKKISRGILKRLLKKTSLEAP